MDLSAHLFIAISFFFFFLSFFLFVIQVYSKSPGSRKSHLPPGPPKLPILGNLHQLDKKSPPHVHLWRLSKTYGEIMSLQLGFTPILVVSSSRTAKQILRTQETEFASRPPLLPQRRLSYNGLGVAFSPYDENWREMRKMCVIHLLSSKRVQSFRSIREEEVSKIILNLSSEGKTVNVSDILLSFTSVHTCRIAFGYDQSRCETSKFLGLLDEAQAVLGSFFVSDNFPFMGWVDKLSGQIRRLEKIYKELDTFYQEIIDYHTSGEKRKNSDQEDVTDILLGLKDQEFGTGFTIDHIKAVLLDIFIAGTDTNAATMVWVMTELMRNPRVMSKVQVAIRSIDLEEKGFVNEAEAQKLPYLDAVVKEAMRLNPPVPLVVRQQTDQKCIIDGYEIRPRSVVFINSWAIGRDPECWEDPLEFLPERFLDSPIDFSGKNFEFIPFGGGRRGCPGLDLGITTVKLVLANLLYSFDWELPEGTKKESIDMDVKPGITVHKKTALYLKPKKYTGIK